MPMRQEKGIDVIMNIGSFFSGYWVGYRTLKEEQFLPKGEYFRIIKPTFRYWYADPILSMINEKSYIFMEQYDRFEGKGKIAASEIKNGRAVRPKTILSEPWHLSFPNVFKYQNDYYMLPECSEIGKICIYKMHTPDKWIMIKQYNIENCVDTSLIVKDDIVFLLTSEEFVQDKLKTRLRLFKIDNFPYSEPIDCTYKAIGEKNFDYSSRNGGNIFEENGELYRVGQNSLPDFYGKSTSVYKINGLSENCYKESFFREMTIDDMKYKNRKLIPYGTHTYSRNQEYEAVDFMGVISPFSLLSKIIYKKLYH